MQSHSQLSHTRIGAVQASCLLVVPCYNEEARLNLSAFESFFAQSEPNEIGFLFVNDGSRDGTLALLKGFQAAHPDRVMVLDLAQNSGKAEAVRQGMLLAASQSGVETTGFWDADLATLNRAANRWGSWVASQSGAMPELSDEVRRLLLAEIEG